MTVAEPEEVATLGDLQTRQAHPVQPGTLWVCRQGEHSRFVAHQATRLVSIFTPALVGLEVNDADGSFPTDY